jgi:1-deoxy-D-xylulose-5-phosphate synthase
VRTGRVVTLEENALAGGFGTAVMECLAERGITVPVLRLGLPDHFIEQGSQAELRSRCGLDVAGVTQKVRGFLTTP